MLFLLAIGGLVAFLLVLIFIINNGTHFAPQAYYRRKRTGAPVAYGVDALGPRRRKRPPGAAELDESPSAVAIAWLLADAHVATPPREHHDDDLRELFGSPREPLL
jgi:hypothetical protein